MLSVAMSEAPEVRAASPRARRRGLLWLGRAMLVFISLGVGGGVAEIVMRAIGYSPIYDVYSRPSILWRHDPLLGWHHAPNTTERYVGPRPWPIEFSAPIHINSLGLRLSLIHI